MLNNFAAGLNVLLRVLFVVLLNVLNLTLCDGGDRVAHVADAGGDKSIHLSLVPARTLGVAPLSVFFDASATTDSGVSPRPFHDLEYRWSFGDASSGNWSNGAHPGVNSKNSATGPVASHVFETPGTYTVTVSAFDGSSSANSSTTITVQNPDAVFAGTNTVCIGATAIPVAGEYGCPTGAATALLSSFVTAISRHAVTGKRVLFKRGDTFTALSTARLSKTGPGIVGAFGTGPAPKIQMTGVASILTLSGANTPNLKDWRVMDLDFDGMSKFDPNASLMGIYADGGFNQFLALRLHIHDIIRGIAAGPDILTWWNTHSSPPVRHELFDEWAIVDSNLTPIQGGCKECDWRVYVAGTRCTIQGNFLDNMDTGGSHVLRSEYMERGVIGNNTISKAGKAVAHAIKLHSTAWCDANSPAGKCVTPDNNAQMPATYNYQTNKHPIGIYAALSGYTEKIVISDNKIIGANTPWTVALGPQDSNNDERLRDIIVERNWLVAGPATQVHILSNASDATIRNNICDMTGAAYHTCIMVDRRGARQQPPNNVSLYNNTIYSGSTGDFEGLVIGSAATHISVINNLGYAPSAKDPLMVQGISGSAQSNNSKNAQIKNTAPGWVSAAPLKPADFKLTGRSYALGAGAKVPVFSDFFLQNRSTNDLGAATQ